MAGLGPGGGPKLRQCALKLQFIVIPSCLFSFLVRGVKRQNLIERGIRLSSKTGRCFLLLVSILRHRVYIASLHYSKNLIDFYYSNPTILILKNVPSRETPFINQHFSRHASQSNFTAVASTSSYT